jgi:hypothetical protein
MCSASEYVCGTGEKLVRTWVSRAAGSCGATVGELRLALLESRDKYNQHWRLEKHHYRTAAQVRPAFEAEVAA